MLRVTEPCLADPLLIPRARPVAASVKTGHPPLTRPWAKRIPPWRSTATRSCLGRAVTVLTLVSVFYGPQKRQGPPRALRTRLAWRALGEGTGLIPRRFRYWQAREAAPVFPPRLSNGPKSVKAQREIHPRPKHSIVWASLLVGLVQAVSVVGQAL